jgi:hypothetical protein
MLKKFLAALAVLSLFSLFACSSDDDAPPERKKVEPNSSSSLEEGDGSSSSYSGGDGEISSSSSGTSVQISSSSSEPVENLREEMISLFGSISIFKTWPYSYTQRNNKDEDLTPFWTCDTTTSTTINTATARACTNSELMATDIATTGSILQNTLTTRDAPLRYNISGNAIGSGSIAAVILKEYRLPANSQAALGLNVYDPNKGEPVLSVGDKDTIATVAVILSAEGFRYKYSGGAHVFRAVINENAFWFFEVPKAPGDNTEINIPFEDFMSAGTLPKDTPFDISRVTQFLWVVEYDSKNPANNIGSLYISQFRAIWWL